MLDLDALDALKGLMSFIQLPPESITISPDSNNLSFRFNNEENSQKAQTFLYKLLSKPKVNKQPKILSHIENAEFTIQIEEAKEILNKYQEFLDNGRQVATRILEFASPDDSRHLLRIAIEASRWIFSWLPLYSLFFDQSLFIFENNDEQEAFEAVAEIFKNSKDSFPYKPSFLWLLQNNEHAVSCGLITAEFQDALKSLSSFSANDTRAPQPNKQEETATPAQSASHTVLECGDYDINFDKYGHIAFIKSILDECGLSGCSDLKEEIVDNGTESEEEKPVSRWINFIAMFPSLAFASVIDAKAKDIESKLSEKSIDFYGVYVESMQKPGVYPPKMIIKLTIQFEDSTTLNNAAREWRKAQQHDVLSPQIGHKNN